MRYATDLLPHRIVHQDVGLVEVHSDQVTDLVLIVKESLDSDSGGDCAA